MISWQIVVVTEMVYIGAIVLLGWRLWRARVRLRELEALIRRVERGPLP